MKKILLSLCFLIIIVLSGCAAEQGNRPVVWDGPSGHQGHHH